MTSSKSRAAVALAGLLLPGIFFLHPAAAQDGELRNSFNLARRARSLREVFLPDPCLS